jgi:hypothetical protein
MIQYKPKKSFSKSTLKTIGLVFLVGVLALGIFARDQIQTLLYGSPDTAPQAVTIQAHTTAPDVDVNIDGNWLGVVTEDYGMEVRYEFRLDLQQRGDDFTGTMWVTSTNSPYDVIRAQSTVRGTVQGDTVTFHETRVTTLQGISSNFWCKLAATLDHEEGDSQRETLTGTWSGIETAGVQGCIGTHGRVTLMRDSR